jgi:hypothetical protein
MGDKCCGSYAIINRLEKGTKVITDVNRLTFHPEERRTTQEARQRLALTVAELLAKISRSSK